MPNAKPLADLAGSYSGKAWFIGNGPSLRDVDLDKLVNQTTFACNRVDQEFHRTVWRPTFYLSFARQVASRNRWFISARNGMRAAEVSFVGERWHALIPPKDAVVHRMRTRNSNRGGLLVYSRDPVEWVNIGRQTINVFFQLAPWLGFSTLILVGCDGNMKPHPQGRDTNHFAEDYELAEMSEDMAASDNRIMVASHRTGEAWCRKHGAKVYNTTPNSAFTQHEFMEFDDALRC